MVKVKFVCIGYNSVKHTGGEFEWGNMGLYVTNVVRYLVCQICMHNI